MSRAKRSCGPATVPWPRNAGTTRCIIISSLPKRAAPRAPLYCVSGEVEISCPSYEGRGCRKSPAQARKFWRKAADAGDVAAWVALGDDAMVQGKGAGAALRAYRKAQKLCASTPDIAYMPQVCLRVAQYETQYISRKKALAQLAEAKQGFLVRKEEGDETAQSWLDETEAVIHQLLERE